jgi:hypothetical protein
MKKGPSQEWGKETLVKVARDIMAVYGSDAPKLLLARASLADQYGDNIQAEGWREIAAIARRLVRRL